MEEKLTQEGGREKGLIPVKGHSWVCYDRTYRGKYRDQDGHGLSGLYFREYKKMRHAVVIGNGHFLTRYRYPKIDIPFSSPMHRWDNLFFCGGYSVKLPDGSRFDTNERTVEYVVKGLKPTGFIVVKETEKSRFIEMVEDKIDYKVSPHFWEGYCEIGFANKGRLKDLFNIEELINSYKLLNKEMGYEMHEPNILKLKEVSNQELKDFLNYDYAHPVYTIDLMIVGLILGYPLESTFAVINDFR